jgi:hypothetical protein
LYGARGEDQWSTRCSISGVLRLARLSALYLAKTRADPEPFFKVFSRFGSYFLRKNYSLLIPDEDDSTHMYNLELVGIDINDEFQLCFSNDVIVKYKSEFLCLQ